MCITLLSSKWKLKERDGNGQRLEKVIEHFEFGAMGRDSPRRLVPALVLVSLMVLAGATHVASALPQRSLGVAHVQGQQQRSVGEDLQDTGAQHVPPYSRLVRRNARRWNANDLEALGLTARQGEQPSPAADDATDPAAPPAQPENADVDVQGASDPVAASSTSDVQQAVDEEQKESSGGGFSPVTIGIAVVLGVAVCGLVVIVVARSRRAYDVEASMPFNQS